MAKERQVASTVSELEKRLHEILDNEGIEYVVHPEIETRVGPSWRRLTPDVVIPSEKLAIEIAGCFVHGCPVHGAGRGRSSRLEKFQRKLTALRRAGYRVLVVWQHDLNHDGVPVRRGTEMIAA